MSDHSITITKIGENTRIEYNDQTYIPYHFCNRLVGEAVKTTRKEEGEQIAQAIEAHRNTVYVGNYLAVYNEALTDAARIARERRKSE